MDQPDCGVMAMPFLPITPPKHWAHWGGLDHGYTDPTCHLWMARIPAGEEWTFASGVMPEFGLGGRA